MSTTVGIEFKNVTKRYGGERSPLVVKGISFTVQKGSLTTILGPSARDHAQRGGLAAA